jgi:metal-responsive CopG/Arc/MetJ family transcriptional regulator
MDITNQVKVYLEDEVLQAVDTYRAELRGQGITTSRSNLVSTALLYYLQHVRAEANQEASR